MAWRTPVPEILVALDARVEWANLTNPFGGGQGKPKESKQALAGRLKFALMAAGVRHKAE